MTKKEIEKELTRIYKEMKSWRKVNKKLKVIPEHEIKRRESIFSLQHILYKIEDAKKEGNKNEEYFNLGCYYITKSTE